MIPPPLAITSYTRPDLLAQMLTTLKAQSGGLDGVRVHLFQDGARANELTECEAVARCIQIFREAFPSGTVHASPSNLGIAFNFDRAEKHLFETLGVEVAYFFEDDLLLSPHYLSALDQLAGFALREPRVGVFAAYGLHRLSIEAQTEQQRGIVRMHHHWGFGLTKRQWLGQRPVVDGYLDLIRGQDYRARPDAAIRAYFKRLGVPCHPTSQDAAKRVAASLLGAARITCVPVYGHYVGAVGEHFREGLYAAGGFAETQMFPEPPGVFDLPGPGDLAAMVCRDVAELAEQAEAETSSHLLPSLPLITALHQGLLYRDPNPQEMATMTAALSRGLAPHEIVRTIANSPESRELRARHSPLMDMLYGGDIYAGFEPNRPLDLQGWNSVHPCFAREIEARKPRIIVDVGVWKGASTIHLAKMLRSVGLDGTVLAVDTFLGSPEHWNRGRSDEMHKQLAQRHGMPELYWQFLSNVVLEGYNSNIVPLPQTSENAVVILKRLGLRVGLVHIDAAHEYESVLRDARSWWSLLEPGGILIGDDFLWESVARAARDFAAEIGSPIIVEQPKWLIAKAL